MEAALLRLNPGAPEAELINTIFRVAHSIKGGSATFGFSEVASFTHTCETILDELRGNRMQVSRHITDLLLKSVDVMREMLRAVQHKEPIDSQRVADLQFDLELAIAQKWQEATMVAALTFTIASRCNINADESMLAGLLHNVGKIYILARANRHNSLFKDPAALQQVLRDWHANVGKAIVENWGFPEHICEAIGEHENIDRTVGYPDVTDVLTVAVMMAGFLGHEADLELNMQGVKAFWRLGLDNEKCVHVMRHCAEEISALRTALGD
jgi:HPt (histidine-containing phosphotransfer) domain-containing protein